MPSQYQSWIIDQHTLLNQQQRKVRQILIKGLLITLYLCVMICTNAYFHQKDTVIYLVVYLHIIGIPFSLFPYIIEYSTLRYLQLYREGVPSGAYQMQTAVQLYRRTNQMRIDFLRIEKPLSFLALLMSVAGLFLFYPKTPPLELYLFWVPIVLATLCNFYFEQNRFLSMVSPGTNIQKPYPL